MKNFNFIICFLLTLFACHANEQQTNSDKLLDFDNLETNDDISTPEDRLALFEFLIEETLKTEAFSPIKEKNLGIKVKEEMQKCKPDFLLAKNKSDLYFALQKLSAARKDRHLVVREDDDGLQLEGYRGVWAGIQFKHDFSSDLPSFYISKLGAIVEGEYSDQPSLGDQLVAINDIPILDYIEDARQYYRYSTEANFRMRMAYTLPYKDEKHLPERFFKENFNLLLKKADGTTYTAELPYHQGSDIAWAKREVSPRYKNYTKVFDRQCYRLYAPTDKTNKTLIIEWLGFKNNIEEDMKMLIKYAKKEKALSYNIILDMTRAVGGSRGKELLTRIQGKPYKTTFGNIRLSPKSKAFIENRKQRYLGKKAKKKWPLEWFEKDIEPKFKSGAAYSSNVPFKCADAPYDSDGMIQPAKNHFKGKLVCLFSPWGGSHLDQFASIVDYNDLGHTIGMPTGGYSNTWEVRKLIRFPISQKPTFEFMWTIGQTITPGGEVLEGNPAPVDQYIPETRENHEEYLSLLVETAEKWLNKN